MCLTGRASTPRYDAPADLTIGVERFSRGRILPRKSRRRRRLLLTSGVDVHRATGAVDDERAVGVLGAVRHGLRLHVVDLGLGERLGLGPGVLRITVAVGGSHLG